MTEALIIQEDQDPKLLEEKPSRPSGINIGGNTVTQATEHLPPDQRTLVRAAFNVARDQNWDWSALERETKISSTTWYRIWTDRYRYPAKDPHAGDRIPLDSIATRIVRWKELWEQRASMPNEGFVETSVWKRVDWICRRAFLRKKMGFIYGESQIGKSTCVEEYARRNNSGQTTVVEIPPSAGVQLMTKCIAKALHVSTATCFEKLLDDVVEALDDSKLLILDEVHRVFTTYQKTSVMRCMDVIRYIQGQTKCGMILCGTNVFRDELKSGAFVKYLKQLDRRGLYELQLPLEPPREDLDLIAEYHGLPPADGEAESVMMSIANHKGFGQYSMRLLDAVEFAAKKKRKVTWDDFIEVTRMADALALGVTPKKRKGGEK